MSFDPFGPQILVHLAVSIESTTHSGLTAGRQLHVGDWGILGIESAMSNRSLNKTLNEKDLDQISKNIIEAVEEKTGATIRS